MRSNDELMLKSTIKTLFKKILKEPNSLKNNKFLENIKDMENILNYLKNEKYLGNQSLIEESIINDLIYESSSDLKILKLLMLNNYNPLTVLEKPNFRTISKLPNLKNNIILYGFSSLILGSLIAYFLDKKENNNLLN